MRQPRCALPSQALVLCTSLCFSLPQPAALYQPSGRLAASGVCMGAVPSGLLWRLQPLLHPLSVYLLLCRCCPSHHAAAIPNVCCYACRWLPTMRTPSGAAASWLQSVQHLVAHLCRWLPTILMPHGLCCYLAAVHATSPYSACRWLPTMRRR